MIRLSRRFASALVAASAWLLPARHSDWGEAMKSELDEIGPRGPALAFAIGCLRAALVVALAARLGPLWSSLVPDHHPSPLPRSHPPMNLKAARPRSIGLASATAAVLLGIVYMIAAGAPATYPIINLAALILGASLWLALGRAAAARLLFSGPLLIVLASALMATAFFGAAAEGASRWVSVGPLNLQVSLIVLPVMLVLYARRADFLGTAAMGLAAAALALQPDRAMAGVLLAGLTALYVARPQREPLVAAGMALLAFAWTLTRADALPAVPYVDQILYTAFDVNALIGLAVLAGTAALVAPLLLAASRSESERPTLLAFVALWAATIIAAALGNYPTPLLGYGGSAVLGYLLSVALLPDRPMKMAAPAPTSPAADDEGQKQSPSSELNRLRPA